MKLMNENKTKAVGIIVAHPDDETLWAGGTILSNPTWRVSIVTLCRGSDIDRASRFFEALKKYSADGKMGDMDDGPDQNSLYDGDVQETVLRLLPQKNYDIIITHNPNGEYTRHKRHEELSRAVIMLWNSGKLKATELWTFAYEDGGGKYFPRPMNTAAIHDTLPNRIWEQKYNIITQTYGFERNSFEAETTPKSEAFWKFTDSNVAREWLEKSRKIQ
jgi:LmbE family N-acetylglucosaminyl deacetylase